MSEIRIIHPPPENLLGWELLNPEQKRKRNMSWDSAVGEFEVGDYAVVPLTTSRMLREEARVMRHCVNLYDIACQRGEARVFSVRDSEAHRVATISLAWKDDYWYLEQMKGMANEEVQHLQSAYEGDALEGSLEPTDLYYVGQEVLQRYRAAWSQQFYHYVVDMVTPK